jgi:hypothetical protein
VVISDHAGGRNRHSETDNRRKKKIYHMSVLTHSVASRSKQKIPKGLSLNLRANMREDHIHEAFSGSAIPKPAKA